MRSKQYFAIQKSNEDKILKLYPHIQTNSGIYVFFREEYGIKFAYVGQAVNLLRRIAQHLSGYQHIDLSLKKHGLYSKTNTTGYQIIVTPTEKELLDAVEKIEIKNMANQGYQLKNKTSGSQGVGKQGIAENRPSKGYHDGLKQGYKNAQKELAKIMQRLNITYDDTKKLNCRAYEKYKDFINISENGTE